MCLPIFAGVGLAAGASAANAAALGTTLVGTTAATLASGGLAAYGAYAQGQSQKNLYNYQAEINKRQAELINQTTEQNVSATQEAAKFESKNEKRSIAQLEGAQKAALAANGVGGGSVTAADIAGSTFDTAKLDELAIRYNADQRSWGLKNNAAYQTWDLDNQRKQYLISAKNASTAGTMNAFSSLLGTASTVGNNYLMNKYYMKGA